MAEIRQAVALFTTKLSKRRESTVQQRTFTVDKPFSRWALNRNDARNTSLEWIFLAVMIAMLAACTKTYPLVTQYLPPEKPETAISEQQVILKEKSSSGSCYGNTVFYRERGKLYWVKTVPQGYTERGIASWYGKKFHGRLTANEERYNMFGLTAAHKTLPLGVMVRVINLNNRKNVLVRINDRGPFLENRIIDLSYAAAKEIAMVKSGLAPVKIIVEQVPYRNRLEGPPSLFATDQIAVAR